MEETTEDGIIKERRKEIRAIITDHCLTCKKLEIVIDRMDKADNKKNWTVLTGIGLIVTLIVNLAVMSGIWKEVNRLSSDVGRNTIVIYETKGVVDYLKGKMADESHN